MDLIYTNANRIDQGVLSAYSLDLSFGADEEENDFEIVLGKNEPQLEYGSILYFEGTEYGGIVDFVLVSTDKETITYGGRTWHGMINSKVIEPDSGADYLTVSGNANTVLAALINRLGLSALFVASEAESAITISDYQFERYCKGYDGIRKMLATNGAKLRMQWDDRKLKLSAVPVANYTESPVDGDIATLDIEQHGNKVNHLICLGSGELAEHEVLHLYADQFGRIGDVQYFAGLDEIEEIYDCGNVESSDELRTSGVKHFEELRSVDVVEMPIPEGVDLAYDIGDIVGAVDAEKTGLSVSAVIAQKIIKVNNGQMTVEYETGAAYYVDTVETGNGSGDTSGYTNLVPTSVDTDGSIFNGVGYYDGYRLNSSGTLSAQEGSTTTGFIACTAADVIRISGAVFGTYADTGMYCYCALYDSDKNLLASAHRANMTSWVTFTDTDGVTSFNLGGNAYASQLAYIRLNAAGSGANMIVTVNEEIT